MLNSGIVENYEKNIEEAVLTIRDPKRPERGSVELVFTGAKPQLKQFSIKNENGSSRSILLNDIEYPKKINETLFSISLEINKRKNRN